MKAVALYESFNKFMPVHVDFKRTVQASTHIIPTRRLHSISRKGSGPSAPRKMEQLVAQE